jgi:6-pyruvoyltetrahydropterin/6-carboxytetrahydropterin synthase
LTLHRRYSFAASHRLHSPELSEEENRRVYGKCNNPFGHGHNYVVEVGVSGPVDGETGMIANLSDLDGFVQREVLDEFDHTYINEQIAVFKSVVPTTENVCQEIFRRLEKFPGARLERVRIEETGMNSFEVSRDSLGGR